MSDDLVNRLEVQYEPDFLRVIRAAKAIRGSSRRTTMRAEKEVRGRMRLQPLVGNLLLKVARRQTAHQILESMRAEDNPEHQKSTNLSRQTIPSANHGMCHNRISWGCNAMLFLVAHWHLE